MRSRPTLRASCACGQVAMEAEGPPLITAVCYCDDCEAAGREIEALPAAPPVLDPDSGTAVVMYRKDRLRCVQGAERLVAHKIRPGATTSRYVASCCNSAMYLGFDDAKHWVDVFRGRIQGTPPPIEARVCTRFKPDGVELPADAPSYDRFPPRMIGKLIGARIAMMFGR